jgi:hypothetical protein
LSGIIGAIRELKYHEENYGTQEISGDYYALHHEYESK